MDVADLDDAGAGIQPQIAGHADRLARRPVDDRVEQRIAAAAGPLHPGRPGVQAVERSITEIGPVATLAILLIGVVQLGGVPGEIDRLDPAVAADHRCPRWQRTRRPVRQRKADRLSEVVLALTHGTLPPAPPATVISDDEGEAGHITGRRSRHAQCPPTANRGTAEPRRRAARISR